MTPEKPPIRYVTAALILQPNSDQIYLVERARPPELWAFSSGVGFSRYYDDPAVAVAKEVEGDLGCTFHVE